MGAFLVSLGVFSWFMFSVISFAFLTPRTNTFLERLRKSAKFNLSQKPGPEFGISLLQVTGIFWVTIGLLIKSFGEPFLKGVVGDISIGIIILAPVWIGAFIAQRRRDKTARKEN